MSVESSALNVERSAPKGAVFLSYARDDSAAARRIAEALRSAGLEVWFDENELRGGDAWDAKIRKQIDACSLFVPVISAHTQDRTKGYFRLEWRLAVEQTHLMLEGVPFLAPVVIDHTPESGAAVPPEFMKVQWSRLPGALPTPQFVEQVKRLLEGKTVGRGLRTPPYPERLGKQAGFGDPAQQKKSVLPGWTWGALTAVIVGVGAALFISLRPRSTAPSPAQTAAPQSEVRQLVAKAIALQDDYAMDDTLRDNLTLAEQLCKRAVELDPADGDAWAVYGRISLSLVNFDPGNSRLEQGRSQVQRAMMLAPDSLEVRLAQSDNLRKQGAATLPEAERILRELVQRAPGDKRVLRMLALVLNAQGRLDEALVYYGRSAALPGGDSKALLNSASIFFRQQRYAEAEATINESLALRPTASGRMVKMWFLMRRDELDAARKLLETVPASSLTDDRAAYLASRLHLWLGEPEKALAILRAAPRDYFDDPWVGGMPKAFMMGWAQQMLGRTEAAQVEWHTALRVVDQRLAGTPNDPNLLSYRGHLLGLTGDAAEAARALRLFDQMSAGTWGPAGRHWTAAWILIAENHRKEALGRLEEMRREWKKSAGWLSALGIASALRHDPEWAAVRTDPRFLAVLAELEAAK